MWHRRRAQIGPQADYEARIFSAVFATMVVLATFLTGLITVGVYLNLHRTTTAALGRDTESDSFLFDSIIEYRARRAEVATGSEQMVRLASLSSQAVEALRPELVDQIRHYLPAHEFTAITIVRSDGVTIDSDTALPDGTFNLPLQSEMPSRLLWKDGFYLETVYPMTDASGAMLGSMVSQQRMPFLDDILRRDLAKGTSNDLLLCGRSNVVSCLASRSAHTPFSILDERDERLKLIRTVLSGRKTAQFWTRTPSGLMAVSAAPVGRRGLAMVRTVAVWEALVPLYEQIGTLIVLITLLLAIARWLMRRSLTPLVDSLIEAKESAERNERQFMAAAESNLNAFFILECARDEHGTIFDFRFMFLNQHAEHLIRHTSEQIVGKLLCEEIPINRTGGFFESYKKVVETGIPLNEEFPINTADVDATWLHYQVVRLGDGVAITTSNISSRKQTEMQLAKALGFTQAIIDASSFSTIVTDMEGNILAVNPATERMLWYAKHEMVGHMTPIALHDPAELKARAAELSNELGTTVEPTMEVFFAKPRTGMTDEGRWTYIRKDGSKLPVQLTVTALMDEEGKPSGYMGVAYDITERKRQEDYISHIAHHDALTGLPTRLLFRDRVDSALKRIQRNGGLLAVMLIDLDNFKDINDSLGHHAGDDALTVVAQRLMALVRASDTVCRMGGDEFTILLDDIASKNDATALAARILEALASPMQIGEETLGISASIGISLYPEGGTDAATLLKNADTAMYFAKGSGKQSYRVFTQGLADANFKRLQMETALKKAMIDHEFTVAYQPQVNLADGTIIGVEALVRWKSHKLGIVSPADFIPVAEQCGVIGALGEWVLRTACEELGAISAATGLPLRLAVNLSPRQLEREGFTGTVSRILLETSFPPRLLEIEITEGVLMSDSLPVWDTLKELQGVGIQVAIDDFGTGFSNIAYLLKLAVNRIKIDRSFIALIEDDAGSNAVVSALIVMAENLGVGVIAEGVETRGQSDILRKLGCKEVQGYFFHRPMSAADLQKVLPSAVMAQAANG